MLLVWFRQSIMKKLDIEEGGEQQSESNTFLVSYTHAALDILWITLHENSRCASEEI